MPLYPAPEKSGFYGQEDKSQYYEKIYALYFADTFQLFG